MKKLISVIISLPIVFLSSVVTSVFAANNSMTNPATDVPGILWVLIVVVIAVLLFILSIFFGKKKK